MTDTFNKRFGPTGTKHGFKAEKKASARLGGALQPGSGSKEWAKGDFRLDNTLVECKSTLYESMSIKLSWLTKVSAQALDISKSPALTIQFVDKSGTPKRNGSWVMVTEQDYKELLERAKS